MTEWHKTVNKTHIRQDNGTNKLSGYCWERECWSDVLCWHKYGVCLCVCNYDVSDEWGIQVESWDKKKRKIIVFFLIPRTLRQSGCEFKLPTSSVTGWTVLKGDLLRCDHWVSCFNNYIHYLYYVFCTDYTLLEKLSLKV